MPYKLLFTENDEVDIDASLLIILSKSSTYKVFLRFLPLFDFGASIIISGLDNFESVVTAVELT